MENQELDQYLEKLVAPTTPQATPTAPTSPPATIVQPQESQTGMQEESEEDVLAKYLTYTDDTQHTAPQVDTPQAVTSPQQTDKPASAQSITIEERIKLERELAAAQERLRMYEAAITNTSAQQEQPQSPTADSLYTPEELSIPAELQEVYKDAAPYIEAIAKKNIEHAVKSKLNPMEEELRRARAELDEYKRSTQAQRQNALHLQLKQVIPDLDEIAVSPEWQAFIKQPDAYGGTRTIAQHVQEGLQSGNVQVITSIVNMYKQAKSKSNPQPSQIAPGTAPQYAPATNPTKTRTMSMEGYEKAVDDYDRGLITWDMFQKIQDAYMTQAIKENMPNY